MSDQNELLRQWMTARDNAAQWSTRERELRDTICASLFSYDKVAHNIDGTRHLDVGNGWDLKAVFGKTYSVPAAKLGEFTAAMTLLRDAPFTPPKPVVVYKPTISTSGWDAAPAGYQSALAASVVMKPNAPQLAIEHKGKR